MSNLRESSPGEYVSEKRWPSGSRAKQFSGRVLRDNSPGVFSGRVLPENTFRYPHNKNEKRRIPFGMRRLRFDVPVVRDY